MNEKDIDNFLLNHKTKIDDNGFSDRVMQSLPKQVDWQHRLSLIWNFVCIAALVIFICYTNVLGKLIIDFEVFLDTIPANYSFNDLLYFIAISLFVVYGAAAGAIYSVKRFIN